MAEPDLVISAGFSDAQLVKEANKIVALYAKKGQEAQKAFVDAQEKVPTNQVVNAHMRELDRLKKAYDPAYAAAQKYRQEIEKLDRALKTGAITQDQYNDQVTNSAKAMQAAGASVEQAASRSYSGIQNASFQIQDFAVQVANGTSASTALAQQLPQLLGSFGALGAVMGAVVAVGVPLVSMLINADDGATEYSEALKQLNEAQNAVSQSLEIATAPLDELVEKYGQAAIRVRELALLQLQLNVAAAQSTLGQKVSELADSTEKYTSVSSIFASQTERALDAIQEDFGLTGDAAFEFIQRLKDIQTETDNGLQIEKFRDLVAWLDAAGLSIEKLPPEMAKAAAALVDVNIKAAELEATIDKATAATTRSAQATDDWVVSLTSAANAAWGISDAAAQLPALFDAANAATGGLLGTLNAAAQAAWGLAQARYQAENVPKMNAANGMGLGQLNGLDVFSPSSGRVLTGLAGGNPLATPYAAPDFKPTPVRGGGGGRKSSKSGGSGKKPKVAEEAKLTREEIEALNETLYGSKDAQKQYEDAMSSIADTMAGVILEGESLRDGLANIFKGIANDILTSGIQQALMQSFGGSNWMMGLFGVRDPLTSALRGAGLPAIPSFDGGGFTGMGPRSGGLDGKGGRLAMIHPNETVLDHTKGQRSGGSSSVSLSIDMRGTSGDKELDAKIARAGQAILAQVPSVMNNNQKRRG